MRETKLCAQCGAAFPKPRGYSVRQWEGQKFCSRSCWGLSIRVAVEARFADMISPEPNTGCWLFTGSENGRGYGLIGISGRSVKAHRFAWESHNGAIPAGMHVLHKCDVRVCVNPDHLFIGTNYDNVQDKMAKGRVVAARGSKSSRAILTEDLVSVIRADPRSAPKLSVVLGVSPSAIRACRNGQNWRHV